MKQPLLLFILLFTCIVVSGKPESNLSSLRALYNSARSDTARVNIMNDLANAYFSENVDSGLYFADSAFKLSKKISYTWGLMKGYCIYGRALINVGKYEEAIDISQEGLSYIKTISVKQVPNGERKKLLGYKATILKNLGISFDFMAIYPEALKYYMECLKLQESMGDRKNSAGTYHNIGGVYLDYEKYNEALSYLRKAYQINKEEGNTIWLINNLTNIAIVYSSQGQYDLALSTYKEALKLYQAEQNIAGTVKVFTNLATMYSNISETDSAIYYANKTLELNKVLGDPRNAESAYVVLGKMYTIKKDYARARLMFKEADKLVLDLNDFQLLEDYYLALFKLDSVQGKLTSAILNLQLAHAYRDSVHNEENVRKLTQTQMNFDFERKESETKAAQDKKDAIAAKELQRQKLMRNWLTGGFMVVLAFAIVFFRQRLRISREKARSEELLLNILPAEVAEELKEKGNADAKLLDQVTVLFTDFKGFTQFSEKLTPKELVAQINECFSFFDQIMQTHGIEKIKTIGDSYMAAGGLPTPNQTHPWDVVNAALEIQKYMLEYKSKKEAAGELFFEIRIGVHTGPVVAGIVGIKKFAYDIWGDTVNTASRMESSGEAGKINISGTTHQIIKDSYSFTHRGKILAKGKGELDMYFVEGKI